MEAKVDLYTGQKRLLENKQPLYLFMIIPLAITAVFSVVFGLFPNTLRIYDLAQTAVKNIFGGM